MTVVQKTHTPIMEVPAFKLSKQFHARSEVTRLLLRIPSTMAFQTTASENGHISATRSRQDQW